MPVGEMLEKASLLGLTQKHWPKSALTDNLGAEAARLRKMGLRQVFVYSDLKKWVPDWAVPFFGETEAEEAEKEEVSREIRQLAEAMMRAAAKPSRVRRCLCASQTLKPKDKERKYTLGLAAWMVAWIRRSALAFLCSCRATLQADWRQAGHCFGGHRPADLCASAGAHGHLHAGGPAGVRAASYVAPSAWHPLRRRLGNASTRLVFSMMSSAADRGLSAPARPTRLSWQVFARSALHARAVARSPRQMADAVGTLDRDLLEATQAAYDRQEAAAKAFISCIAA